MRRLAQLLAIGYFVVAAGLAGLTASGGPVDNVPLPLPLGPVRTPVVVSMAYGTEKEAWLTAAVQQFEATQPRVNGRPIQIQLQGVGSREGVEQILAGSLKPVVFSPASEVFSAMLADEWKTRHGGEVLLGGQDAPQPLVLTPLVVVGWEERAQALWPRGPQDFWGDLHAALADPQGWAARGHPEWGLVKFGHTSPETSNSGLQTLILLAYAYHHKTTNLSTADVLDPGFQQWMQQFELAVLEFGDSTGTFMTNMVRFGPSKYDFVVVYENLAIQDIEAARGRWGPIRIFYPPATAVSVHPYAILDAAWVTAEQKAAARRFRDYLLSQPIQELARQYGFRPGNAQVAIINNDPQNPFNKFKSYGLKIDIAQQVVLPPADVTNTLVELWRRKINR